MSQSMLLPMSCSLAISKVVKCKLKYYVINTSETFEINYRKHQPGKHRVNTC